MTSVLALSAGKLVGGGERSQNETRQGVRKTTLSAVVGQVCLEAWCSVFQPCAFSLATYLGSEIIFTMFRDTQLIFKSLWFNHNF